jgi:Fe-S-cluster containining protein
MVERGTSMVVRRRMAKVVRSVVRSFKAKYAKEAAAFVRLGGHAVYWETDERARVVVSAPAKKDWTDLGVWSMFDLGLDKWTVKKDGPFAGLAQAKVPDDAYHIVRRRAERDSIHPEATREVSFDCLACGACCKDNEVVLDDDDKAVFLKAGRGDLLKKPWAKRKDGKVILTLKDNGKCHHLRRDNKCKIYDIRPSACSVFPVASECCISAREYELEIFDGLPPEGEWPWPE